MTNTKSVSARGAFTLIELLVVIAIIAVLIGILLPSLSEARERARTAKCGANLRQWGIACYTYTSSNNGVLPCKGGDGARSEPGLTPADAEVGNWDDPSLWFNALPTVFNTAQQTYGALQSLDRGGNGRFTGRQLPTAGSNSIFICPSFTGMVQGVYANTQQPGSPPDQVWRDGSVQNGGDGQYFWIWGHNSTTNPGPATDARPFLICYQWNSKLAQEPPNQTNANLNNKDTNAECLKLTQIDRSSDVVLMTDKRVRQDEIPPTDPENPNALIDPTYYNYYYYPLGQPKGAWQRFTTRHNDGGNILFIDGHVEYAKYRDVVTASKPPIGANNNIADWNAYGSRVWDPFYPAR